MNYHGSNKEPDRDDPYELVGNVVPGGGVRFMAECLVEEFARLGWEREAIVGMFHNPFYQAAHLYFKARGKEGVEELVDAVLARCPVVRAVVSESFDHPVFEQEQNHV